MKHCILAKFADTVSQSEKKAYLADIRALFSGLLTVKGIYDVEVIPNVVDRPNRYDVLIRIDMDESALVSYDGSKPHREWKARYGPLLEKKAIFDYRD